MRIDGIRFYVNVLRAGDWPRLQLELRTTVAEEGYPAKEFQRVLFVNQSDFESNFDMIWRSLGYKRNRAEWQAIMDYVMTLEEK